MFTDKDRTEREGVNFVAQIVNEMGSIWRETTQIDIGIDGEIELVEGRKSSGFYYFIQIKSGESYFKNRSEVGFSFFPQKKHIEYWRKLPLPVLIIIYSPKRKKAYWNVFQRFSSDKSIHFSWKSVFNKNTKEILIKNYQKTDAWHKYQKKTNLISDMELTVFNAKISCMQILSQLLPEPIRDKRQPSSAQVESFIYSFNEIFNFKTINLRIITSADLKFDK
ncbi:hypothetical protein CEE45_00410 [Candidatus Heimdallarchaeota archaeon B3_Heim]|nr:MAG: hypothetical protein CEE45_00410 [Candidatus Heimdallarchaeota archaeon B3_Heim]